MSSPVSAQIGFERNTAWNPEYEYNRHKPRILDEFISDKDWKIFVHDIDTTLKPAQTFQNGTKVRKNERERLSQASPVSQPTLVVCSFWWF
jgi:uncharacterized membrane protein